MVMASMTHEKIARNRYNIQVGQEILFVPHRYQSRDKPKLMVVETVGTRWAQLEGGPRFDIETLEVDGGNYSSPGSVKLSSALYEEEMKRMAILQEIRLLAEYSNSKTCLATTKELEDFADLLRKK
jgi:hypothetical protein